MTINLFFGIALLPLGAAFFYLDNALHKRAIQKHETNIDALVQFACFCVGLVLVLAGWYKILQHFVPH